MTTDNHTDLKPNTKVDYKNTIFENDVNFDNVTFNELVNFTETEFCGKANFIDSKFKKTASFDDAVFKSEANFSDAEFKKTVTYKNTQFNGNNYFAGTKFEGTAGFTTAKIKGALNMIKGILVSSEEVNSSNLTEGFKDAKDAERGWRALKLLAKNTESKYDELRFFAQELRCHALNEKNIFIKIVIKLYDLLSAMGLNFTRPLIALAITFCIFWIGYAAILKEIIPSWSGLIGSVVAIPMILMLVVFSSCDKCTKVIGATITTLLIILFITIVFTSPHAQFAASMSFQNTLPFIPNNVLFPTDDSCCQNILKDNYLSLQIMRILQIICSTICLFLFALGLRNRLRMG